MTDQSLATIEKTEVAVQEQFATWSETRAELAKAMCKAQAGLGMVAKSKKNDHFKSKYAELSDVLEAVLPALNANGLSLIQTPSFNGKSVAVTSFLLHESGEWMESTLKMNPTKSDPQGVGSCITYARRYAALAIAGAAPEDDDGNAASTPKARTQPSGSVAPLDAGGRSNKEIKDQFNTMKMAMGKCVSVEALTAWKDAWGDELADMPEDFRESLRGEFTRMRDGFKAVDA
jgi:hypothetical protein